MNKCVMDKGAPKPEPRTEAVEFVAEQPKPGVEHQASDATVSWTTSPSDCAGQPKPHAIYTSASGTPASAGSGQAPGSADRASCRDARDSKSHQCPANNNASVYGQNSPRNEQTSRSQLSKLIELKPA